MYIFMFTVTTIIGGYFAFRYFSIANALKETNKELKEIKRIFQKTVSCIYLCRTRILKTS